MPIETMPIAEADRLAKQGICPCCGGTGDEDGTGQACGGDTCEYCHGEGCGGSCSWCGGTGKVSGWTPRNPSYRGYVSEEVCDAIEVAADQRVA